MNAHELRINVYNSSKVGHTNVSFYEHGQHVYTIGANIRLNVPQLALPQVVPFERDDGIYQDETAYHAQAVQAGTVISAGVPVTDLEYEELLSAARELEGQTFNYSLFTEACIDLVEHFYEETEHPGVFGDLFPESARTGSFVWHRVPVTDSSLLSTWPEDVPYYTPPPRFMPDPPASPTPRIFGDLPSPPSFSGVAREVDNAHGDGRNATLETSVAAMERADGQHANHLPNDRPLDLTFNLDSDVSETAWGTGESLTFGEELESQVVGFMAAASFGEPQVQFASRSGSPDEVFVLGGTTSTPRHSSSGSLSLDTDAARQPAALPGETTDQEVAPTDKGSEGTETAPATVGRYGVISTLYEAIATWSKNVAIGSQKVGFGGSGRPPDPIEDATMHAVVRAEQATEKAGTPDDVPAVVGRGGAPSAAQTGTPTAINDGALASAEEEIDADAVSAEATTTSSPSGTRFSSQPSATVENATRDDAAGRTDDAAGGAPVIANPTGVTVADAAEVSEVIDALKSREPAADLPPASQISFSPIYDDDDTSDSDGSHGLGAVSSSPEDAGSGGSSGGTSYDFGGYADEFDFGPAPSAELSFGDEYDQVSSFDQSSVSGADLSFGDFGSGSSYDLGYDTGSSYADGFDFY